MYDFGIIGGLLYLDGELKRTNLYINKDHIVAYNTAICPCKEKYNAKGCYVLPGLVDPHVHFELGSKDHKSVDDFYQGSISAAYGGITTFIDFLDPIDKAADLRNALSARYQLAKRSMVDYSFHVTVKNPVGEVEGIVKEMEAYGMNSIKLFTTYSESGRRTYDNEIIELLKLSKQEGFIVLAHTEQDSLIHLEAGLTIKDLPRSRPKEAELNEAIHLARMVAMTDGNLYMVHLSHGETLKALADQFGHWLGRKIMVESCPHYFYLDDSVYKQPRGYLFTMAPPLRDKASMALLYDLKNHINTIGTDHCAYMANEKEGKSLIETPMGIGGVEHAFDLMFSKIGIEAVEKMSVNPSKIFGMYPKKGSLKLGTDADIMIYDPEWNHVIEQDNSAADYSVYEGLEVKGRVVSTICKGQFVIKNRALVLGSVGHFVKTRQA